MKCNLCIAALIVLLATSACAEDVTAQDMQVVGRAFSFIEKFKRQNATLAVVFDPSDPNSVRQMESTLQSIGKGMKVGDRMMSGIAVDERQIGSALRGNAVFATTGVDQAALANLLRQSGMPCFTVDTAQVRDGACMVAVRSRPSVSISFSSRNASAASVSFATAFIMMVREL